MGASLGITLVIVFLDQISKNIILQKLAIGESITIINNFFYITHVRNSGAAWGFLADKTWGINILTLISIIVSLYLVYLIYLNDFIFFRVFLSLILGGSIGNLIDRVRFGNVVDFLSFKFGNYHFPVFNIADMSIVIGGVLPLIYFIFNQDKLDNIAFSRNDKKIKRLIKSQ